MERRFCQSCGMPLGDETLLETESSGKNAGNIVFIAIKRALSPRTARWRKWRMCLSYSRKEGGTEQPRLTKEAMLRWFST